MPIKKAANKQTTVVKKKTVPKKKTATKKVAAKKTATKKVAAKKTPATKKVTPKKVVAKKTVAKKGAGKKKTAKKVVAIKKSARAETSVKKAAVKKAGKAKPRKKKLKASDFIKRPSHTPAIFKPANKRAIQILFTLEDVREVLKKRPTEEQAVKQAVKKVAKKSDPVAVAEPKLEGNTSKHHAASLDDILGLSPNPVNAKGGNWKVPRKYQKYHRILIELRDHVRAELNLHSSDTLKRSQKEDSGDISISADAGTDTFDRDFALSLLSSEQESLNEIESAIERIYSGNYGHCEVTGEAIKPERLEAVPFTRFSLEGQRQHESNTYKRASRAGAFLNDASGEPIVFGDDDGDN